MRILITGGTGLIGRPLSALLANAGHNVTVLSRNPIEAKPMPEGVSLHRWDLENLDGWGHLVDGADAIINLAGAGIGDGRWSKARKTAIRESRLNAGHILVEAVEAASIKPKVVIQSSAIGYYGSFDDGSIVVEDQGPGDDFVAKVCFDWEITTAPISRMGIRRPIIRTGVVLSNDGGALQRMKLPYKFFMGGKLGDGSQWMSWIHMVDEVRAIQFLLEHDTADGPFNLTAPNPVTNSQLSNALGDAMGRPAKIPAPSFAIRGAFGEMADIVLKGQRVLPHNLQALGFEFEYPNIRAALQELVGEKKEEVVPEPT